MGKTSMEYAPLDAQRAKELEFIIDKASHQSEAVVIDPSQGVMGSKSVSLISPNENTNALVRFGRHYQADES